jgi:hypothetical protein
MLDIYTSDSLKVRTASLTSARPRFHSLCSMTLCMQICKDTLNQQSHHAIGVSFQPEEWSIMAMANNVTALLPSPPIRSGLSKATRSLQRAASRSWLHDILRCYNNGYIKLTRSLLLIIITVQTWHMNLWSHLTRFWSR